MKLLKRVASEKLKLSFDLSLGARMRLKSPQKATGVEIEAKICSKERRKSALAP
jgi:hypothetical protein